MIKLIATDIDGTILIPDSNFRDSVKSCISNISNSGVKVVLVTGRMNAATRLVAKDLGLETPIISYQGGLVTYKDNVLYERYLTEKQANQVIDWAKEEKIHINFYNNDKLYSEKDDMEIQKYCSVQKIPYTISDLSCVKKDKVNKVLAIDYSNPDRITALEKELQSIFKDIYVVRSAPCLLEFCNKEATKAHAVEFLQNFWNIKKEETLTIGDQNNDIALLKAGGIKVAMGNATDELKSIADYITDTVENDGFVKAVEKYCNLFVS